MKENLRKLVRELLNINSKFDHQQCNLQLRMQPDFYACYGMHPYNSIHIVRVPITPPIMLDRPINQLVFLHSYRSIKPAINLAQYFMNYWRKKAKHSSVALAAICDMLLFDEKEIIPEMMTCALSELVFKDVGFSDQEIIDFAKVLISLSPNEQQKDEDWLILMYDYYLKNKTLPKFDFYRTLSVIAENYRSFLEYVMYCPELATLVPDKINRKFARFIREVRMSL